MHPSNPCVSDRPRREGTSAIGASGLLWIGVLVPNAAALTDAVATASSASVALAILLHAVHALLLIWAAVAWLRLLRRSWASIQDGHARTTPSSATAWMLVPVFGVYWVFQAVWGFARDFNAYLDRHYFAGARLSEPAFLALSACFWPMVVLANVPVPSVAILPCCTSVLAGTWLSKCLHAAVECARAGHRRLVAAERSPPPSSTDYWARAVLAFRSARVLGGEHARRVDGSTGAVTGPK